MSHAGAKTPARAAVDSARAGPKPGKSYGKERQSDDGNVALADSVRKTR